jgi:hypothetical protein
LTAQLVAATLRASRRLRMEVLCGFLDRAFSAEADGTLVPRLHRATQVQLPVAALQAPSALGMRGCTWRFHERVRATSIAVSLTLRRGVSARGIDAIEAAFNRSTTV